MLFLYLTGGDNEYVFLLFTQAADGQLGGSEGSPLPKLSGLISCDIAILSLRHPISHNPGRLALPQNGALPPPGI